jgi:hypothetical protein
MLFAPTEEGKKCKLEKVGSLPSRQFQLEFDWEMLFLKLVAVLIIASIVYTITTKFIKDKHIEILELAAKVSSNHQIKF